MNAQALRQRNWWSMALLVTGILWFLTVVIGTILLLGVNRFLSWMWLLSLPVGIINLVTGIALKKHAGAAVEKGKRRLANSNLVVGALDALLGAVPWLLLVFFPSALG